MLIAIVMEKQESSQISLLIIIIEIKFGGCLPIIYLLANKDGDE